MIRLAVRAAADEAEMVLAALLELAPSGVEQVDLDGEVELAVYGAPGELPELDEGEAEVAGFRVVVSGTEVDDDWAERWKRFHQPVLIADKIYVRPPWEAALDATEGAASGRDRDVPSGGGIISGRDTDAPSGGGIISGRDTDAPSGGGIIDLVIDPGRAFGTGAHPTTRLCLEMLVELTARGSVVDLGCGSGVLSIAAARLGFGPISALDADGLAIEATEQNARDNGVALELVGRANLRDEAAPQADVVLANLMRPLLLRVAQLMDGRRPALLIASGLLDEEADEVAAAFAPMAERYRLSDKGWSALLLQT